MVEPTRCDPIVDEADGPMEGTMDTIDYKMVAKGASIPHAGILDQSRYHVRLVERHEVELVKKGWKREFLNQLVMAIALIDSERSRALDARDESKANRYRQEAAVAQSKAFKADLVMAFDDLHFDRRIDSQEHQRVRRTNGPLGRSPTAISKYLGDVRSLVEKHDSLLRPYFGGKSALAELDFVKDELDQAQEIQEIDYKALPLETLKFYEAKGRALFLIEKANRIGKRAFAGQAELIALYNKDLIQRARKARRKASGIEPVEGDVESDDEETA